MTRIVLSVVFLLVSQVLVKTDATKQCLSYIAAMAGCLNQVQLPKTCCPEDKKPSR